jgi:crotonobetainyl-CoA:carnitine CoA-transferase CaiB-like acyl-CoA transferase
LVYLSQTGLGHAGPHAEYVTYGPQLMARAGWNTVLAVTDAEGAPMSGGGQLTDQLTGAHEAFAIIVALLQRERTGRGQYVDVSMLECQATTVARELIRYGSGDAAANRAAGTVFVAAGDDRWVGVQDSGDAYARLTDRAAAGTWSDLTEWLRAHTADDAMIALQQAGIPAARVSNAADVAQDPQLVARGAFDVRVSPEFGPLKLPALPIVLDGTRSFSDQPAPRLGQHTHEVLGGLLLLTADAIAELESAGVV